MKLFPKGKIAILLIISSLLLTSSLLMNNSNYYIKNIKNLEDDNRYSILDNENLRNSKLSGRIHIDKNWSATKDSGICSGEGTYSNPYIIEDLVINGENAGSCILIKNSNAFFKIENCTVYNSGGFNSAGIKLSNVNNSQLIKNTCSTNYFGIYLRISHNNTISENIVKINSEGISLNFYNSNNIVSENIANQNDQGITVIFSNNNIITRNIVNFNFADGIYLHCNENNIILGNTAKNNRWGIRLVSSNNNFILRNILSQCGSGITLDCCYSDICSGNIMDDCGFSIDICIMDSLSSHVIDSTNLINGKSLYYYCNEVNLNSTDFLNAGQIILINCNDSQILDINLSRGTCGIVMYYCNDITVSGNTIDYNSAGIYLFACNNINILNNFLNLNGVGILFSSHCFSTNISGNAITNSRLSGIELVGCYNGIIFGNTLFNNTLSIQLVESHNNRIYFNNIRNDINNLASKNLMNSSKRIIYIYKNETYINYLGNYWSNYTGIDADNDGIGDTPYIIGEEIDYFPLIEPIEHYKIISEEEDFSGIITGYHPFYILGILSFIVLIISKKLKK